VTEIKMAETVTRRRAKKSGVVTSDKMDKSVVVRVDRIVRHKMYKRYLKRSGDTVEIVESRPMSKNKRWRISRIVRRAGGAAPDAAPQGE
jgi:small subunit ribosomal protein S17